MAKDLNLCHLKHFATIASEVALELKYSTYLRLVDQILYGRKCFLFYIHAKVLSKSLSE